MTVKGGGLILTPELAKLLKAGKPVRVTAEAEKDEDEAQTQAAQLEAEAFQRKLQFLIGAISEMPDLKLQLKMGRQPSEAVPETKTMKVFRRPGESQDCTMGKAYHEVAHILFTKRLPKLLIEQAAGARTATTDPATGETTKVLSVDAVGKILNEQFNSLEDFRIERAMPLYFPASAFYLKTKRAEIFGSGQWGWEHLRNPLFNLHMLLSGADIVKFLPDQGARRAVRKAAAYLRENKFDECRTSEELWKHVLNVFSIMKPYYIPPPEEPPEDEEDNPFSGSKGVRKPKYEIVRKPGKPDKGDGKDGEDTPDSGGGGDDSDPEPGDEGKGGDEGDDKDGKDGDKGKGKGKPDKDGDEDEGDGEPDEGESSERPIDEGPGKRDRKPDKDGILGRTMLALPKTKDWHKVPPAPVRVVKECNASHMARSEPITDVPNLINQGRKLGRTLKAELKLKEEADRRLSSGKLDMKELRRQLIQHGDVVSTRIFMRDRHNKYAHTVSILIDFSGSMEERSRDSEWSKLKAAKSAALVLSACMDEMHVPHSVAGFSAVEGETEIVHYEIKPFTSPLSISRLRDFNYMSKPKLALQNRDGASVRYAAQLLKNYGKGTKVLFVISDGQPHHPDGVEGKRAYNYGYNSRADMIAAVKEAEQMGVQVIGIAIEPEAARFINETYKKGFHIGKIDELPARLLNIYRRTIRPIMR